MSVYRCVSVCMCIRVSVSVCVYMYRVCVCVCVCVCVRGTVPHTLPSALDPSSPVLLDELSFGY